MSVQAQPSQGSQDQQRQAQYVDEAAILAKINEALKIQHNPYSENKQRRDAMTFLEGVKTTALAPSHGYNLASDPTADPIIRHYGLSLLEHSVKQLWAHYPDAQHVTLRQWVVRIAQNVSARDPLYVRNKIAQLWVEVAKRSWAEEWMTMDQLLFQLWEIQDSTTHKELVLSILEMLSDEIFSGDDSIVDLRDGVLSKACVEIFTPAPVLAAAFPKRTPGTNIRCGDDGWISRIKILLDQCLEGDLHGNSGISACALRGFAVLYSIMSWAVPKAIIACACVPTLCNGLASSHVAVQKAALEATHALYARPGLQPDEFTRLVLPLYGEEFIHLCRRLFEWARVDAEDLDDDKYQFSKKFSELLACLGNHMDRRFAFIPQSLNREPFFELLLLVAQSPSLVVSIPVLVTWARLLDSSRVGLLVAKSPVVAPLLDLCASRLVRYENFPEDTKDPSYLLLLEDTDTLPERHAFLGNYRRYSVHVIESIVALQMTAAMTHVIGQTEKVLNTLYDEQPPFRRAEYNKYSLPALQVDRQCTVVESALKGYYNWRSQESTPGRKEEEANMESSLEVWCNHLLEMNFEDPAIRKRVLQLLVAFSTSVLDRNPPFMFKVLEHILMTWPATDPFHNAFNEAIKDLQAESIVELQRLASKMPDHLLDVYDQLEAKIKDMMASGSVEEKRQVAYQSFLFIIVHRSTKLDGATKVERLRGFIQPVQATWQSAALRQALSSYASFSQTLSLDRAQKYILSHGMSDIKDWGAQNLDEEGFSLQAELEERQQQLPLRATKTFLTYSVEKVDKNSDKYEVAVELWKDSLPTILPSLLQFMSHAHATHNPANWSSLPQETRPVVSRVLSDRFWQAGISEGSKDDFYARVIDKKGTLEGLASTIRGAVRFVRETCYAIIYCMTRLDAHFYGFSELPAPLAHALFADSGCLSSHQLINVINLMRYLVDNCPVSLREQFLPPLLATGVQNIGAKVKNEWDMIQSRLDIQASSDDLTEEMKAESILRQLTYSAVIMLADFLDPARRNQWPSNTPDALQAQFPSLRKFCLTQSSIVEPILMFCTHAIRMRDTRCCSVILRVLRSIIPEFHVDSSNAPSPSKTKNGVGLSMTVSELNAPIPADVAAPIREFISSEVLKACITSLHEPYFVDLQKELAALIASIIIYYQDLTPTPVSVLLTLPKLHPEDIERALEALKRPGLQTRQQRAVVLELLKELKGVSVSEMGKLDNTPRGIKRNQRSKMLQHFMSTPPPGQPTSATAPTQKGPEEDVLNGIATLFQSETQSQ